MKYIFFGTSEFGVIVLEKLVQAGYKPVLVVTTPDKPAGRNLELTPPPVKVAAQKYSLEVVQPVKPVELSLFKFEPDLFVVASYGEILPREVLDIPKKGTLNVHPSLLPQYRGPSPVHTAILNGDKSTGVTIMLLDEKMDHGPIVANSKFEILNSKLTYLELHNKLAELGAELLIKTIPEWVAGSIKAIPQDDSQATYTKIFKKEDGKINWNEPAEHIERQIRALAPWPGTWTF
ncbi:MAG: methionyl-tRNA formyltransferase, partial [bacterium]|nr:methionyl-tRNA formyltransferase [bacterium]